MPEQGENMHFRRRKINKNLSTMQITNLIPYNLQPIFNFFSVADIYLKEI